MQDLKFLFVKPQAGLIGLLFQAAEVVLSSGRTASSPSVVSFVDFTTYEWHVIVWYMNIYPGRRVSGLLTGKG